MPSKRDSAAAAGRSSAWSKACRGESKPWRKAKRTQSSRNALQQLAALQGQHRELQQQLLAASFEHQGGPLAGGGGVNLIRVDNSLQCPALPLNAPALIRPQAAGWRPWLHR